MSKLDFIREKLQDRLKEKKTESFSFGSSYNISEVPKIVEKRGKDWVFWGEDNLYPLKLKDMKTASAIHNAIVKTKTKIAAGDGLLINEAKNEEASKAAYASLDAKTKAEFDYLMKNEEWHMSFPEIERNLSNDLQTFGCYAYSLVFNSDFKKLNMVKFYNVHNIRCGKKEGGKVTKYYYHEDWTKERQVGFKPDVIYAYNKKDTVNFEQMVFRKVGDLDYYGEPSYSGALTWIQTDFQMGLFHLSNITNGMNPGMHFSFYKLPATENDKQQILDDLQRTYMGAQKAGRFIATFSQGKELAAEVKAIETSNLDKQLIALAELCDKKILTGHQLTSPLLVGISTSGQLGGNTELQVAYQIFDNVIMASDRMILEQDINFIFQKNIPSIKLEINPFNPFKVRPQ